MNTNSPDSWMPMRLYPPEVCETHEVKLGDGSTCRAFWTGSKWWRGKELVQPVGWRPVEEEHVAAAT